MAISDSVLDEGRLQELVGRRVEPVFGAVAVALVALACLGAAPASAAPAWLDRVDLSAAGQDAIRPQVVVDPQGNAIATWNRYDGSDQIVQAAVRGAGGAWQTPVDLSDAGLSADSSQVAVDAQGNAVAIWERSNGTHDIVQSAVRPAGGTWQTPVDVSEVGGHALDPQVAVDAQGNAFAVWRRFNGTHDIVQAAVRPAGGAWQAPVDVSDAGQNAKAPQVAVDPHGNAVAVWLRSDGTHDIVQAAVRPDGDWRAPVDLSKADRDAFAPQVAVDPQGNAIAIWHLQDGLDIVQAADRPVGGTWTTPVDLSDPGGIGRFPQVAIDAQGNAVATWQHLDGAHWTAQAAQRETSGEWQTPVDLSAPGQNAFLPQVAMNAQGNAVAVWERSNGTHGIVQAAVRGADGAWQTPVDQSAPGQHATHAQVAVDAQGNAIAIWSRYNVTNDIVQAAGFDAAGPLLNGLTVPASGSAGEPLPMSVSPFDWWSPLGATSWTFGDGTTATGTAVTHTYANAGTYTVGVDASDALANATSTTRTITIAPATTSTPPPTPPPETPPDTPPALASVTGLQLSPSRFRAAASGPPVKAAAVRSGARVSYTLNVATTVRFTVERVRRGRRVGDRCVKQAAGNRKARRCPQYVPAPGGFDRERLAGADRFRFTGRLRGRALKPGRYRLIATPAGGTPARASFRIAPGGPAS